MESLRTTNKLLPRRTLGNSEKPLAAQAEEEMKRGEGFFCRDFRRELPNSDLLLWFSLFTVAGSIETQIDQYCMPGKHSEGITPDFDCAFWRRCLENASTSI